MPATLARIAEPLARPETLPHTPCDFSAQEPKSEPSADTALLVMSSLKRSLERDGFKLNRTDSRIGKFLIQPAGWSGGQHGWENHIREIFESGLLRRLRRVAIHGERRLRILALGSAR
jgi:hypothetical protein